MKALLKAIQDKTALITTYGDSTGDIEINHNKNDWSTFFFDFEHSLVEHIITGETSMSVTEVMRETTSSFTLGTIKKEEDEEVHFTDADRKVIAEAIEYHLNTNN